MKCKVCRRDDVHPAGMVRFEVEGRSVLVAEIEGKLYAAADTCSHAEASLSEGRLVGRGIECPMHGACFDIRTGEPLSPPATDPIDTYEVFLENGEVFIELPDR